jgi:hypothetical protein
MPVGLFAGIVIVFVIVGVIYVRSSQKRRIVERLPLEQDENVLLEEAGLKVFHRFRRMAVRGGGTVTHRVRAVLTDRRILVATGGPEGKHKFVLLMILDYTAPAQAVPETGYAAYKRTFQLENGYPTYAFSAADVSLEERHGEVTALGSACSRRVVQLAIHPRSFHNCRRRDTAAPCTPEERGAQSSPEALTAKYTPS